LNVVPLRHELFEAAHGTTNQVGVNINFLGETRIAWTGAVEPTETTRPPFREVVTLGGKNPAIYEKG